MNEQNSHKQRTIDLLNGSLDGELSSSEQVELDSLLAGSDKVRRLNEDLKLITGIFDELPEVEPPHYLQESIERQIRLPEQSNSHEEKSSFFGTWLPAHWMRTGFALAAGAVLTVGIYEMGSGPMTAQDASQLVGTIVKPQAVEKGILLDSIQISTETLNGSVELRNTDGLFTLDVKLSSDGPTQVVVKYANRGLEFEGITRMQDRQDAVSVVDGAVNISTGNGEQRYTMNLRRIDGLQEQTIVPLELEFFANSSLVYEARLSISQQ